MRTILHLGVLALTIFALSQWLPDLVSIHGATTAILVAVVFSVLNFFLGWLIRVVLFVPAVLTLGLLLLFVPFIVNTVLLWVTDQLLTSFEIVTFRGLLLSAGAITAVNFVFHFSSARSR
ncbi:MAG: phage holin family protein [Polyangiaceae bacterium]|nr:phage holin family protein [Polyangiaceae bacterium]